MIRELEQEKQEAVEAPPAGVERQKEIFDVESEEDDDYDSED